MQRNRSNKSHCVTPSLFEFWYESNQEPGKPNTIYNIPRACLLNRSLIPAMDLKSNRSGVWRYMLETCRRLRRLCRKRSDNVARHDKTPVKSTLLSRNKDILSRDTSFMSRRIDIMLWLLHRSCNTCTFSLPTFAVLRHTTIFWCRPVYYKTLILWSSWSILFWNHANDVTSLVKVHREYSPAARILRTKFD